MVEEIYNHLNFQLINVNKRLLEETDEEYCLRKFINHNKWIKEAINNIETTMNYGRTDEDKKKDLEALLNLEI